MNKHLSYKISLTNIFLAILIVILHSNCRVTIGWENDGALFSKIIEYFSYYLCAIGHVAVPLFYIISAYLFYYNIQDIKDIWHKIVKRTKTLLFPYLLWNILFVLLFICILYSPLSQYMHMENDLDSACNIIKAILNSEKTPLWFIRNLFIYIVVSPVLFYICRNAITTIITIILTLCISFIIGVSYFNPLYWFPVYLMGLLFTKKSFFVFFADITKCGYLPWLGLLFWGGLLYLYVEYDMQYLYRLIAPLCVWKFLDFFAVDFKLTKKIYWNYSFFIYCTHFFVINILQKILFMCLGGSNVAYLFIYVITPIVVIPLCISIARVMEICVPRFYSILTGGR